MKLGIYSCAEISLLLFLGVIILIQESKQIRMKQREGKNKGQKKKKKKTFLVIIVRKEALKSNKGGGKRVGGAPLS
jgi:hypothetical protein